MHRLAILTALVSGCSLTACDADPVVPVPPLIPPEGFGPSSLHLSLEDSTGAVEVSGSTRETRFPEPGDTLRSAFQFFEPDSLDAGELLSTCVEVVGEPEALYPDVLTSHLTTSDGVLWVLTAACDEPEVGVWERVEAGAAVAGGRFSIGIAVP